MKGKIFLWIILVSSFGLIFLSGIQIFGLIMNTPKKTALPGGPPKNLPSVEVVSDDKAYAQDKSTGESAGLQTQNTPSVGQSPSVSESSESVAEYMKFLREKEKEIKRREQELKEREKILRELEKDLDAKLARLEELQKSIEAFNKQQEQLANERLDTLVKIYVTMKPKDAAALLEKLDDDLVTQIISRMSTDQAAKIIASMDIKKAARITQKLTEKKEPTTR